MAKARSAFPPGLTCGDAVEAVLSLLVDQIPPFAVSVANRIAESRGWPSNKDSTKRLVGAVRLMAASPGSVLTLVDCLETRDAPQAAVDGTRLRVVCPVTSRHVAIAAQKMAHPEYQSLLLLRGLPLPDFVDVLDPVDAFPAALWEDLLAVADAAERAPPPEGACFHAQGPKGRYGAAGMLSRELSQHLAAYSQGQVLALVQKAVSYRVLAYNKHGALVPHSQGAKQRGAAAPAARSQRHCEAVAVGLPNVASIEEAGVLLRQCLLAGGNAPIALSSLRSRLAGFGRCLHLEALGLASLQALVRHEQLGGCFAIVYGKDGQLCVAHRDTRGTTRRS